MLGFSCDICGLAGETLLAAENNPICIRLSLFLLIMRWHCCLIFLLFVSCTASRSIVFPESGSRLITGTEFFRLTNSSTWAQRDSLAFIAFENGNIPAFLKKFIRVKVSIRDSAVNRKLTAVYYVSPDYFSIGDDIDWARVPLTPMMAQKIADQLNCFLPTRKMVDDIYKASVVKLNPEPLTVARDSSPTMYQHHQLIEAQRQGRKGLISGIKKDVVITGLLTRGNKMNRVAIYGWHKSDGKAIQPLYTGHVNWYVDYSHGIRFVYKTIKINDQYMKYEDVLKHPVYHRLLCDEQYCDFYKYPY